MCGCDEAFSSFVPLSWEPPAKSFQTRHNNVIADVTSHDWAGIIALASLYRGRDLSRLIDCDALKKEMQVEEGERKKWEERSEIKGLASMDRERVVSVFQNRFRLESTTARFRFNEEIIDAYFIIT